MRCFWKLLEISCKDHVTNKDDKVKICEATGPYEDLTITKRSAHFLINRTYQSNHAWNGATRQREVNRQRWEDITAWRGIMKLADVLPETR